MSAINSGEKIKGVRQVNDAPNKMELFDSFPQPIRLALKNAPYSYAVKNIPQDYKGMTVRQIVASLNRVFAEHIKLAYKDRGFEP